MAITLIAGLAVVLAVAPPARADIAGTDVVTTCNGSGPGSLSAAVQNAAPGDTITFSVTCPPSSPIILTSTINITADLTIDGPGPSALAVSGNNTVQVFDIASGVVVLSGLTVEDGLAGSDIVGGGGILNNSSLTISDSTVSNNASTGSGGGYSTAGAADSLSRTAPCRTTCLPGATEVELATTVASWRSRTANFQGTGPKAQVAASPTRVRRTLQTAGETSLLAIAR